MQVPRFLIPIAPRNRTEAAGKLQAEGLIKYSRGKIIVLDRNGLEACVCECYAVLKKEYDRLLPAMKHAKRPR